MNGGTSGRPSPDGHCFLALLPADDSVQELSRLRGGLEAACTGSPRRVRWTAPAALHLTLRFAGPATDAQVQALAAAVAALATPLAPVAARRFGIWPNRARPRLLVLELDPDAALVRLAAGCEARARAAGFAPETRGFRAHVTLGRLRPGCAFGSLPPPPRALAFAALALLQGMPGQPATAYRELARAPLARALPGA